MKFKFNQEKWLDTKNNLLSKSFICSNCGKEIASNKGYESSNHSCTGKMSIYICHNCNAPNIFDGNNKQVGNVAPGKEINKLPEDVKCVYNEARACMSVEAYTAAVMLFRKIVMNMAVEEGATEGDKFINYINYLCDNGFVHRRQTKQADEIRVMGNEANHKIECKNKEEAEKMLKFIEQLLITNYEFADEDATDAK